MTAVAAAQMPSQSTSTGGRRYPEGAIQRLGGGDAGFNFLGLLVVSFDPGTTASPQAIPSMDGTSSGPEARTCIPARQTTDEALLELRRRSGLTWELLSELFNVSRRSVHHWANGRAPSAQHELEIRWVLDAIRHLDEGNRHATHDRLLTATNGLSPFDLLVCRRYTDVLRLSAGAGAVEVGCHYTALSDEEWAKRRPPPPALLLDSVQDRPAAPVGKVRIAYPVGRKKKLAE